MVESLAAIVKDFVPPVIWKILKKLPINLRRYYGVQNLDEKLEKYLPHRSGYFVELGANDGLNQSNTFYFEKFKGWHGVLIEPSPQNFLRLLSNRSSENSMYCNACVSFEFKDEFVSILYSNLMSSPLNLESDLSDPASHAAVGKQFMEKTDQVFKFGSVAKTLNQILDESKSPKRIDLLSLDVEGAEIEVLKGIDHDKYRFSIICVEVRNIEKMKDYMSGIGYLFVEKLSQHDFIFKDSHV
jgi:FkbM family methyltransferase